MLRIGFGPPTCQNALVAAAAVVAGLERSMRFERSS